MTRLDRAASTTSSVMVFVDFPDALYLGEEPVDEAEVPVGGARYGCDGLRVGEVLGIQRVPEVRPSALQDEVQFFLPAVFVGESDPAVELG
jgi:hypothetical protein